MCNGNCSHSEDFLAQYPEFELWHDALTEIAQKHDVSVADEEAWRDNYEMNQYPEETFYGEYPEYAPAKEKDQSSKVVGTPCRECPWRRESAAGWLGSHTPGDFLALSDQGAHLPCHLHVSYEDANWQEQAKKAPQCAGHAIFLANRCKLPQGGQIVAKADHALVFSRPHEFVAHHKRMEPQELANTLVWDLYEM